MNILTRARRKITNIYRTFISFDAELIFHMVVNRIRYRNHLDFLKADRPYKFQFIRRHYAHLIEKCKQNPISNKPNEGPIWVCWWQGEEQMPDIIRLCYASLKKNAPSNRPLILLHSENYYKYADIPRYIIDKFEKKVMSIIHFTDILRMTLLAKHGGLWIDASVFLSSKMPDSVFSHSYFSGKEPYDSRHLGSGQYTVFMLGAAAEAPWIVYGRDALFEYWKKSWKLLDYLLINYILMLALDSIPTLKEEVMKGILDTPHINTIQNKRDEVCDSELFEKMISECSFYKLSYKLVFRDTNETGELTYYGRLLNHSKQAHIPCHE